MNCSPFTLLIATIFAPLILVQALLLLLKDSGISLLPCFLTCGVISFPTSPITVERPLTNKELYSYTKDSS